MSGKSFRLTPVVQAAVDRAERRWPVFLSRLEAAAIMGIEVAVLDALIEARRITSYQIGGTIKLGLQEVRTFDHRKPMPPPKPKTRHAREGIGVRLRFAVLERDGFRCRYCGATPDHAELQVDHVVSVADGGPTDMGNLITACIPCNLGKGRRSLTVVA